MKRSSTQTERMQNTFTDFRVFSPSAKPYSCNLDPKPKQPTTSNFQLQATNFIAEIEKSRNYLRFWYSKPEKFTTKTTISPSSQVSRKIATDNAGFANERNEKQHTHDSSYFSDAQNGRNSQAQTAIPRSWPVNRLNQLRISEKNPKLRCRDRRKPSFTTNLDSISASGSQNQRYSRSETAVSLLSQFLNGNRPESEYVWLEDWDFRSHDWRNSRSKRRDEAARTRSERRKWRFFLKGRKGSSFWGGHVRDWISLSF